MMDAHRFLPCVILLTVMVGGCAAHGGPRPSPFPRPAGFPATSPALPGDGTPAIGLAIVEQALALRGSPYAPGGAGPDRFDCSGLVQYVYSSVGIVLPRTVAAQRDATEPIALAAAGPGDLLFFRTEGRKPSHVAIAIGDGTFVHAPNARGEVRVESLGSHYWRGRVDSARRVQ
jgi:cell wall-associated NlpC family hydrolase